MKRWTKITAILMLVVFSLTMFAGMAIAAPLSGNLTMSGSTTVKPLADLLAADFMKKNKGVKITIAEGGSGAGIKDVNEGRVNIGNASRALKDTDPQGLVAHTVAYDALAVIVHPKNPVKGLTKDQVTKIFSGEIKNWQEVGGKNAPIFVNQRAVPSGTLDYFMEEFMVGADKKAIPIVSTAKHHASNKLLIPAVAKNPNAIGFTSLGSLNKTVKGLPIDGSVPTIQNAVNGTYKHVRPLNLVTKGQPTDLTKAFIDYAKSPAGQAIAGKSWVPLPKKK
ncbi:MAG: phosphate ABC transporter substrate-binding protein [Bacillota bacterium]|nr:phosphate ABC transporter substrate-binding protein [Bacillota bacterium]